MTDSNPTTDTTLNPNIDSDLTTTTDIIPNPEQEPGRDLNLTDEDLANKAYQELSNIFYEKMNDVIIKAGEYLIKTFFDDKIENAREKKSTRGESLNQLFNRLKEEENPIFSKVRLYQSINLIIQNHDIEKNYDKTIFYTYKNLSLSIKIKLISIKNLDEKIKLINMASEKKLSVREFETEIKTPLKDPSDKAINYQTLLNSPKDFCDKNIQSKFKKWLAEHPKKVDTIKSKLTQKNDKLKEEQQALDDKMKQIKSYIKTYEALLKDLKVETPDTPPDVPEKQIESEVLNEKKLTDDIDNPDKENI